MPSGRLTVADCLRLTPLSAGSVVAGAAGLDARSVDWVTVMEWPVEDFVAPGELALTTGTGCDEARFVQLAAEVAAAGAAALCVGIGDRAPFATVPEGIVALGDAQDFPVIALDWDVRFADVTRAVIDRLLSERYRAAAHPTDRLAPQFTDALLRRDGMAAIAQALEQTIAREVAILDRGLARVACGPAAAARLGDGPSAPAGADRQRLRAALDGDGIDALAPIPELGLPAAVVARAHADGGIAGYVLALERDPAVALLSIERHALEQAATAVAIETLRRRAAAEAEARVEGDFLWQLAAGEPPDREQLAVRASLLGYDLDGRYGVAVAEVGADLDPADRARALDELGGELRRRGAAAGVHVGRRGRSLLVLVPEGAGPTLAPRALAERVGAAIDDATVATWGVAAQAVTLPALADAVREARRAIAVGCSLHGTGRIFEAEALAPFMMLSSLAADPHARRAAQLVLDPIVRHDETMSRQLLHTLAVYLEEHCNTSSAARRLHLNRHSLLYRLRKIEALTGRDLARHQDRFLFELSLRLARFAPPTDGGPPCT